jgi:hypothetical protein
MGATFKKEVMKNEYKKRDANGNKLPEQINNTKSDGS